MFSLTQADCPEHYEAARQLFGEYLDFLGLDLSFQRVNEELSHIAQSYGPPAGGLLLLAHNGEWVGCAGIRPIGPGIAELKRMYIRESCRGLGAGRLLMQACLQLAADLGYKRIRLDTLERLSAALNLYRMAGFHEIPAYYDNPLEGVVYMERSLGQEK